MKDSSVIFMKDWSVLIKSLSDENQLYFWGLFMQYDHEIEIKCENEFVLPIWNFIKSQLDKMKEKYFEKTVLTNRNNGKLGGRPKKDESETNPNNPMGLNETQITPKDKDNNNDKENDNDIPPTAFSMYRSLLDLGAEKQLINDWLKVRKTKKATNTKTALYGFISQVEKSNKDLNSILKICIENSWSGFKVSWLENLPKSESKIIPGETHEEKIRREYVERMTGKNKY